jgi:hypothetical protein
MIELMETTIPGVPGESKRFPSSLDKITTDDEMNASRKCKGAV